MKLKYEETSKLKITKNHEHKSQYNNKLIKKKEDVKTFELELYTGSKRARTTGADNRSSPGVQEN